MFAVKQNMQKKHVIARRRVVFLVVSVFFPLFAGHFPMTMALVAVFALLARRWSEALAFVVFAAVLEVFIVEAYWKPKYAALRGAASYYTGYDLIADPVGYLGYFCLGFVGLALIAVVVHGAKRLILRAPKQMASSPSE